MKRTFDSRNPLKGVFGYGWTSLFDARASGIDDPDNRGFVRIDTEENDTVFVAHSPEGYRQVWPMEDQGSLTFDGTNFIFQEDGETIERIYRRSDGRLIAIRTIATGREVRITYDAAGLPQRVADSWGNWSWSIVVDAARALVSRIDVETRPDLSWSYSYDAIEDLRTVTAPVSAAWRTYLYTNHDLTDVRDPLGNLIETHQYNSQGIATTSSGAEENISSFTYELAGRVPGETITRVQYASGQTVDQYIRWIAGRPRVVETRGGCSSCASGDLGQR